MTLKIIKLAERTNLCRYNNPEQMLTRAVEAIKEGETEGSKAVLLILNDSEESYEVEIRLSNITLPEQVALLEAVKMSCLRDMGFT